MSERSVLVGFFVHGTPAPQGSKRHVGRGILIESSRAVKPWREAVKHAALDVYSGAPMDGPLSATITFVLARPKSAPKTRLRPDRRPDLDKLLRSTFDALGEAGVWIDDSQVVEVAASKVYVGDLMLHPGAVIEVRAA